MSAAQPRGCSAAYYLEALIVGVVEQDDVGNVNQRGVKQRQLLFLFQIRIETSFHDDVAAGGEVDDVLLEEHKAPPQRCDHHVGAVFEAARLVHHVPDRMLDCSGLTHTRWTGEKNNTTLVGRLRDNLRQL